MSQMSVYDVMERCGVRNPRTIYVQIRKGNLTGNRRKRELGGLPEWVFEPSEVERFVEWFKATPRYQR